MNLTLNTKILIGFSSLSSCLLGSNGSAMYHPSPDDNAPKVVTRASSGVDEKGKDEEEVAPAAPVENVSKDGLHSLAGILSGEIENEHCDALKALLQGELCCGKNFQNIDFRGQDLSQVVAKGCDFGGSDLRGTGIEQADTYGCTFVGSCLETLYNDDRPAFNRGGHIQCFIHEGEKYDLNLPYEAIPGLRVRFHFPDADPLSRLLLAHTLELYGSPEEEDEAYAHYVALSSLEGEGLVKAIRSTALNNQAFMLEMGRGIDEETAATALDTAGGLYERNQNAGDTQFFNFVRFFAVHREDWSARYQLAKLLSRGRGTERDPAKAFYWHQLIADEQRNPRSQYHVGESLLHGVGVDTDKVAGAEYIRRVAEQNHGDALYLYSLLLERGEGVPLDLRRSATFCQRAADEHLIKDAQRRMGHKYLNGEGIPKDLNAAAKYFRNAAAQISVSSMLELGRIHLTLASQCQVEEEKRSHLETSFKWYQKALGQDETSAEALYGLGVHYTRGGFVVKDVEKAKDYLSRAAALGHPGAIQRLRVVNPEYQRVLRQRAANERLYDKVKQAESITILKGFWKLFKLEKEFKRTRKLIKQATKAQQHLPLRVNFDTISADPYMCEFMVDVNAQIPDDMITDELFDGYFEEISRGYAASPTYLADLGARLPEVRDKLKRGDAFLKKKFLFLYQKWCAGEDGVVPPANVENANVFHNGRVGAKLLQNLGRCNDGMSDFLDEEKWRMLSNSDEGIPLYIRLSQVVAQYKLEFINLHKNPLPGAHEEAVEATQLLSQRMRLPLGLPVDFVNLYNPLHGAIYDKKKYDPQAVMRRFIEGGMITFESGEDVCVREFSPYTPDFLVSLVRRALEDDDNKALELEHLNAYLQTDDAVQGQFEDAFIVFEETPFFDPMASGSQIYKGAFIEYLLVQFGYLERKEE